jgi:hypothetical protein
VRHPLECIYILIESSSTIVRENVTVHYNYIHLISSTVLYSVLSGRKGKGVAYCYVWYSMLHCTGNSNVHLQAYCKHVISNRISPSPKHFRGRYHVQCTWYLVQYQISCFEFRVLILITPSSQASSGAKITVHCLLTVLQYNDFKR